MNLKAAMGRRIFAKALPAVPLAATQAHGLSAVAERQRALGCGMKTVAGEDASIDWEIKRKKLDAARAFIYDGTKNRQIDYFRRRKNQWTTLDPNITALRSVSDQHKIHMHIAAEEKLDEERASWQDSILKMFGLDTKRDRYELF